MATPTDVRDVLSEWVQRCGPSFLDDPRRVRAVLHDAAPDSSEQTAFLSAALEDGIARRILDTPPDRLGVEMERMTAELAGRRGLARPDAEWAVVTVAAALGAPLPPPPGPGRSTQRPVPPRRRRGLLLAGVIGAVLLVAGGVVAVLLLVDRGPVPPGGLQVAAEEERITVRWDAVTDAAGYQVLRDDELLAETTQTEYVDTEVEGGTEYDYSVRTVEDSGERSEVSATESVRAVLPSPAVDPPTADGLTVTLTWAPVAGAEHYEISRGGSSIADNVTGTTYTDEQSEVGRPSYTVTAVDDDGGGRSSTDVAVDVAPWGTMQTFASAFPLLFPVTPEAGLQDPVAPHRCAFEAPDGSNAAVERVRCTFDNGIVAFVDRFTSAQQVADDLQSFITPGSGQFTDTWFCTGGSTEGQFTEWTLADGAPFELFTFVDPGLELFDLFVVWTSDRSVGDLNAAFLQSPILCD
ncbi:fibronectin type III domain-containing protein [Geodermatophilus sp. SYSU D01180]